MPKIYKYAKKYEYYLMKRGKQFSSSPTFILPKRHKHNQVQEQVCSYICEPGSGPELHFSKGGAEENTPSLVWRFAVYCEFRSLLSG